MRTIVGVALASLIYLSPEPVPVPEQVGFGDVDALLSVMERKTRLLLASNDEITVRYMKLVYPIEEQLVKRAVDPALARQAAWAIVKEAEKRHLSPRLVTEILKAEDPWLITDTVSSAGAVGWMQIMPFHVFKDHHCGTDLTNGAVNVCYGTDIFRQYIGDALSQALRVALLRYNGCVKTPGCDIYATRIMLGLAQDFQ